jgi:outer membrane protein assembly factor BamD (BamD/ComL family)
MRTTKTIILSVGALLLASHAGSNVLAQGQKSAEELYQTAIIMKEGRGDLEGAIKLFSRILSKYPKDRRFLWLENGQL